MEDINRKNEKSSNEKEKSTSKNPLVERPSKLDIKPVPIKEDPSSERKLFGKNSIRDLQNLKLVKRVHHSSPKKVTNARTNIITTSTTTKEKSIPSTCIIFILRILK